MMVPPKVGWTLFHQSAIKKTCPQMSPRPIWWRHFLWWDTCFSYPGLCQFGKNCMMTRQASALLNQAAAPPPNPLSSEAIAWITAAVHPLSCYKFLDRKSLLLVFLFPNTCIVIYFTSKMLDQYCKIASDLKKKKQNTDSKFISIDD